MIDFSKIASAALAQIESLIPEWLPNGKREGHEWKSLNPTRADKKLGSFSVNLHTGKWGDFASGDAGKDLISLYAYLFTNGDQGQAARDVAQRVGIEIPQGERRVNRPLTPPSPAATAPEPKVNKSPWSPILPAPTDAPERPKAHIKRGAPERVWCYRNADGAVLGYIYRFKTSDGGKEIIPLTWCVNSDTGALEWRWMAFPDPRPLYGLDRLVAKPDSIVLVVEGEKCADVGDEVLPALACVTWPGGSKAADKADWSPLAGRKVVIWPDCDAQREKLSKAEIAAGADPDTMPIKPEAEQPGVMAAEKIATQLMQLGCIVRIVKIPPPGEKPSGWDIADAVADGINLDDMLQSLRKCAVDTKQQKGIYTPQLAGAGIDDWRTGLMRKESGALIDCRENIYLLLEHHPEWRGVLALDEFSNQIIKRRPPPFPGAKPGEWDNTDDMRLGLWLAQRERLIIRATATLSDAVNFVSAAHPYHPVREYLDKLVWDGVRRLDDWLLDFLGVPKSEYSALAGRFFFIGMVARVYAPGCHNRAMPILEGGQFQGKSTALRIIGGDWFGDTPFDVGDKDAYQMLRGKLLYEIAELDAFSKAESTRVKSFVSSPVDTYRAPYERRTRDWPRQVVFAGTTNQDEYFKDSSGNTRYWPLKTAIVASINLEGLQQVRDQLFAEAVALYRANERWFPSRTEQVRLFDPEQEAREIGDPWYQQIYTWASNSTFASTTTLEVLTDCLKLEVGKIDNARQMATRIGICMRKLGWGKKRSTDGSRSYFYERPEGWPPKNPTKNAYDPPF